MDDKLRARRERTWEMLVALGVDYGDAVSRIAQEFDCAEGTVKSDISRMDTWVGKLDANYYAGVSAVRKLLRQEQKLEQLALQAQQDEDIPEMRKIRKTLADVVSKRVRISQKLGLQNEEPTQIELAGDLSPEDEALLDAFTAGDEDLVDLEEMR